MNTFLAIHRKPHAMLRCLAVQMRTVFGGVPCPKFLAYHYMSMSRNQKILQGCVSAICIITPEIFLATSGWDRKVNKMIKKNGRFVFDSMYTLN